MKYNRNQIINVLNITPDQIAITNGNSKSAASAKIFDTNDHLIFMTHQVWKGVVGISKVDILKIQELLK